MADEAVVELLGTHQWPADQARPQSAKINLAQHAGKVATSYCFGIDQGHLAAELRRLADMLDAKDAVPQTVFQVTKAALDDFTMHWVTIEFATKG